MKIETVTGTPPNTLFVPVDRMFSVFNLSSLNFSVYYCHLSRKINGLFETATCMKIWPYIDTNLCWVEKEPTLSNNNCILSTEIF